MLISRKPEMQQIYDSGQFQYETETQQRKVIKGFNFKTFLDRASLNEVKEKILCFFQ